MKSIAFDVQGTLVDGPKSEIIVELLDFLLMNNPEVEIVIWSNSPGYVYDFMDDNNLDGQVEGGIKAYTFDDHKAGVDLAIEDDSRQLTLLKSKKFILVDDIPTFEDLLYEVRKVLDIT